MLDLKYGLSKEQKEISEHLKSNFIKGIDSLVYAVCGAGKTELSFGVIACALSKGLQVGFALPRRDVVIELYDRIKAAFPHNSCIAVYGGHTSVLTGDIVVLTTHQLYRYESYFDLLVMDEIDAFPFKGDATLHAHFRRSVRGRVVLLTATPSPAMVREFQGPGKELLELRTRFHRHPMPVPRTVLLPSKLAFSYVIKKLREYGKKNRPCLVFVPSIEGAEKLYEVIKPFTPVGSFVHSMDPARPRKISAFKKGKLKYLVTTSVLERGVTVEGLQVIVTDADHRSVYDQATLVQISGRAGRKASCPDGEVLFLATRETPDMRGAIEEIKKSNEFLLKLPK